MAHHFILLRLNPFDLRADRKGWWFELSVSQLRVCSSAEGGNNVSWPWLSPLRGWGSLTMVFTGKVGYIYHELSNDLRLRMKLGNIEKISDLGGDIAQCPVSPPEIKLW